VLVILGYDSVDNAIKIANDTDFGLAGNVAGADLEKVRAVAAGSARAGCRSTTASISKRRSAATRRAATDASGASSASTNTGDQVAPRLFT